MGGLGLEPDRSQDQIDQHQQPAAWANRIFAVVAKWQKICETVTERKGQGREMWHCNDWRFINIIDNNMLYIVVHACSRHTGDKNRWTTIPIAPPCSIFLYGPPQKLFFIKNGFLSVQFPSSKKVFCEFNLLQWKVLWLSAACAFCQSVRMYTQAVWLDCVCVPGIIRIHINLYFIY